MTTASLETASADLPTVELTEPAATGRGRLAPFLSKAVRVSGYGRVGIGALAVGTFDGQPARLVLPVERIVAADLRLRLGGARLLINVGGSDELRATAVAAAESAATACEITAGEISIELRLPSRASSGTDLAEAVALAVIDAFARASEAQLTTSVRGRLANEAVGGRASGLAAGGPAIVGVDGTILAQPVEAPRLLLVLATPAADSADAADTAAGSRHGALVAPPADVPDTAALALWLKSCSAGANHPVVAVLTALAVDHPDVLAVVGGHTAKAPVAAVLDARLLTSGQVLAGQLRELLPEGWVVSLAKTASS
jgi:hypothetical protein